MSLVGVLGGGSWGLSLARAARRAGSEVVVYTRRHKDGAVAGVRITADLGELCQAPLVIVAAPSNQARTIAHDLGDHLSGAHLVVHGIRGLFGDELATISQILREETPVRRIGALGGPVQASELNEGRASAMVVGSAFVDVTEAVHQALASDWLHLHRSSDLVGVEWASALVGCLSIGVGYVQEHPEVSPGLLAALVSRAVDEAVAVAVAAGAQPMTFYGLAGWGDLIASMTLRDRPEVVLGRELAKGASLEAAQEKAALRIEAIELVPRIAHWAAARRVSCPVFQSLADILRGVASAEDIVKALFVR